MHDRGKKFILLAVMLLSAFVLSGCALLYGDGLLALPSLPAEYVELQDEINAVLSTGAVSAAAESGANRQAIQLVDLDGDGENETVAFFREPDGSFLIKAYRSEDGDYREIGSAQAVGLTLHAIHYPVVSVTGQKCLAVCWGIDESSSYGLDVYAFTGGGMENILNVQYSSILVGDLSGNSLDELCVAVRDQVSGQMSMRIYGYTGRTYEQDVELLLCSEAKSVSQMLIGRSGSGARSLFVDSAAFGGGYVTDVLTYDEASARPVSLSRRMDGDTGMRTWRSVDAFSADIDGDGITEVPAAASMMSAIYPDEKNKLDWLEYDDDRVTAKLRTCHMPSDGWYLRWMDGWDDKVVIQTTRYSRMVKTVFFLLPDDMTVSAIPQPDDGNTLLTVYVFNGDNSQAYISVYEAAELARRNGRIYAYVPGSVSSSRYAVDPQQVTEAFTAIETVWSLEAYR
ncbi:MAG: hypothetical protein E7423_10655 [Ruminococcaceae bacterium]|jgi:hypothetical protein|nr:hypothetical protein [Oscillospiraceae bacterium]